MRLELTDLRGDYRGWVEWEPATGELSGPLAASIRQDASWALSARKISTHPHPSGIPATDPLRNLTEFAALIGQSYRLPPELEPHYPVIEDDWDEADLPPGLVF